MIFYKFEFRSLRKVYRFIFCSKPKLENKVDISLALFVIIPSQLIRKFLLEPPKLEYLYICLLYFQFF
jgi:hypothetical protein